MKPGFRQWLKRLSAVLTTPPSGAAERAERIVALQRNIVLPTRLVAIAVVFYMLYQSPWLSEVGQFGRANAGTNTTSIVEQPRERERQEIRATSFGVVFETIQNIVHGYTLLIVAATTLFFVVQKFPPGSVQWIVFVVGIGDGIFLAALTVLTGGYGSILYWVYPAVIVLNAISIPLATPQIVLNLLLTIFFGAAGLIEANAQLELMLDSFPMQGARKAPRETRFAAAEITNLVAVASALKQSPEPLNRVLWRVLPEPTRQKLSGPLPTGESAEELKAELALAWNNVFFPPSRVILVTDGGQDPTETSADPYVLRLAVLLLLTFCCYGVQVLVAAQERAQEEQKEFFVRTGQLQMAGRLAAEFAHQIKNPLTIVNNVTFSMQKALQGGGKLEAGQQIAIIREEVAKADQIITQIMGYAQLSEGRVEKLDVEPEINRAIQEVFPDGAMPHIKVHREFAEEFPPLLMQRRHFSESVLNLLQNARDAVQSGGNIYVKVDCLNDYSVQIVVRDDGGGIPPDKIERIFEAYYTTKERGTGLGLAIVKHNADLYGGRLRVESELGKGAKFTLVFPAKSLIQLGK